MVRVNWFRFPSLMGFIWTGSMAVDTAYRVSAPVLSAALMPMVFQV